MKTLIFVLLCCFCSLQYQLWLEQDGILESVSMYRNVKHQQHMNTKLEQRNSILEAEVMDLKSGQEAIEERARHEMGMIKQGEIFYQFSS